MKKCLIVFFIVFGILAQEQKLKVSKVLRVHDGDTFYVNISGIPDIFGKDIGIRLLGIDTPELTSKDSCNKALALAAKNFLERKFKDAKKIELSNIERDKYFRLDAIVYINGKNINQMLVDSGYAKPYTGEGPKPIYECNNVKKFYGSEPDADIPDWQCLLIDSNGIVVKYQEKYGLSHAENCVGVWYSKNLKKYRLTWKDAKVITLEESNINSISWDKI